MSEDKNDVGGQAETATQEGRDLAEQTKIEDSQDLTDKAQTVNERQTSAHAAWDEIVKNNPDIEEWIKSNPDFHIADLRENFGDSVADAWAEVQKADFMKQGFVDHVGQQIEDTVKNQTAQAEFRGTIDGKEQSGKVLLFTDANGNELTLVGGGIEEVFNADGSHSAWRIEKDGVAIFRDKDGNLVQKTNMDDVREGGTMSTEDYANTIRQRLQEQKTAEIQSTEPQMPEQPKTEHPQGGELKQEEPTTATDETEQSKGNEFEGLQEKDIQPIGTGTFGPVYDQFRGKPKEAIAFLSEKQEGEAVGALHHPSVGDIDLVWGKAGTKHSDGFGLSKLVKYHPEVVEHLQDILNDMKVDTVSPNRVNLSSDKYKAAIRLDYDGESKTGSADFPGWSTNGCVIRTVSRL